MAVTLAQYIGRDETSSPAIEYSEKGAEMRLLDNAKCRYETRK